MNEGDQLARQIIRQARTPAQGNIMRAGSARSHDRTTETLVTDAGYPLRLWVPGVDPWGVEGFYFGSRNLAETEI